MVTNVYYLMEPCLKIHIVRVVGFFCVIRFWTSFFNVPQQPINCCLEPMMTRKVRYLHNSELEWWASPEQKLNICTVAWFLWTYFFFICCLEHQLTNWYFRTCGNKGNLRALLAHRTLVTKRLLPLVGVKWLSFSVTYYTPYEFWSKFTSQETTLILW